MGHDSILTLFEENKILHAQSVRVSEGVRVGTGLKVKTAPWYR